MFALLLTIWYKYVNDFEIVEKMLEMKFSKVKCKIVFCITLLSISKTCSKADFCNVFQKQTLWLEI